jgi:hypothetical protein
VADDGGVVEQLEFEHPVLDFDEGRLRRELR